MAAPENLGLHMLMAFYKVASWACLNAVKSEEVPVLVKSLAC
jgi:hypothetical protein